MANPVLERQFGDQAAADATLQAGAPKPSGMADGQRMTIGSVLFATGVLLILVAAGAAFGWANAVAVQRWYWLLFIGLLVLVFLTVSKPQIAPLTGAVYSMAQGAFVGSISRVYEEFYDGIVFLALIATLSVFVAMLFLYATRIIKVTEKTRSVIIIATVGIGLLYLVSFILSLFSVNVPLITGSSTTALVFSIFVVIAAALNLLLDFQVIESGISQGAPKVFSWFAAFGLMVTIVWLYIEMLRLLAIVASRR
ncbi:MAG TPA: Bax inhibitor-1/YccA family protein [Acidimicrobiia bacterium]